MPRFFRKAATRLDDLEIDRVSGVDKGANGLEGWVAVRAADSEELGEFLKQAVALAAAADVSASVIDQAMASAMDIGVAKALADGYAAIATATDDAEVQKSLNGARDLLLASIVQKEAPPVPEFDPSTLSEEATAYVKSLADELVVAKAAQAKAEADAAELAKSATPTPEADTLEKALATLPEPLRKAFEDSQRNATEALAKAEAERKLRVETANLAKARNSGVSIDVEQLAKAFEAADLSGSEPLAKTIEALVAQNVELQKQAGIFKSIGATGEGPKDAWSEIESVAKAHRTSDATLTQAQAIERVYETHPELVARYQKEGR